MGGFELIFGIVPIVVIVIVIMATSVRILRDYERVMTSQREADRVFREWGARAGWLPTPPAERKAERKAETPQDPEALRQEVSSLREQLKALEERLEERRES